MKLVLVIALLVQVCGAWVTKSDGERIGKALPTIYDEFEFILDESLASLPNSELVSNVKSHLSNLVDQTKPIFEMIEREGKRENPVTFNRGIRQLATDGVTSDDDAVYNNPSDKYEPSSNVENGAAISGVEFDTTEEYLMTVLIKPILLFCLGFASLFFLNLGLCCRCCCKCCSCSPKEDITEKELSHQKMMISGIEILLIFSVLLADTLCFYGYTYLDDGVSKLNDAFDGLIEIFTNVKGVCYLLYMEDAPNMTSNTNGAKSTCHASALPILNTMSVFNSVLNDATKALYDAVVKLLDYMELGQDTVNNFVAAYLRAFVFVIWAFAALATFWFVLFRIFKSELGTKFAIFWGELTFFLILVFNVPMMILSQVLGDFCVQPTHNVIKATPDGELEDMVRFYSHCTGTDTIGEKLTLVQETFQDLANATQVVGDLFCSNNAEVAGISSTISTASSRFGDIREHITCENFQSVWFTLFNDCFCDGIYSGIYSLWVSQFITSFFLFFLIVVASISYQYFHPKHVKKIVPTDEESEETVKLAEAEAIPSTPFVEVSAPSKEVDYGEGGDVEMTEMADAITSEEII